MAKKNIKIGIATEEQVNQEFIDAWHRAEKGEITESEERIYFAKPVSLLKVLSDRKLKILYTLRSQGISTIQSLSNSLGRSYKTVYNDVQLLKKAGLIHQTPPKGVFVPWDKIQAEISLYVK
jgi:predicted transcriptional regulator